MRRIAKIAGFFIIVLAVLIIAGHVISSQKKETPYDKISLEDIRKLSQLGDELTFDDFRGYFGADVSSNLNYHIMIYAVEGGYRLIVRTDGKQIDSVNLEKVEDAAGSGIDIRYYDVDEFLKRRPLP